MPHNDRPTNKRKRKKKEQDKSFIENLFGGSATKASPAPVTRPTKRQSGETESKKVRRGLMESLQRIPNPRKKRRKNKKKK